MDSIVCPICLSNFDTVSKPPRIFPKCGHSLCTECIMTLWKKNPEVICPLCKGALILDSIDDLPVNWGLLSSIMNIQIFCDNHPDKISSYFDKNSIQCLCLECAQTRDQKYLKSLEDNADQYFSNRIAKLYKECKNAMSAEDHRSIRNARSDSTSHKYKAYKKLVEIANTVNCDRHPDRQATLVNPEKGRTFCDICVMPRNSQSFVPILRNHELKELLAKRIEELIEELPVHVSSNLLKRELAKHKHMLLSQLIGDIKELIDVNKKGQEIQVALPFNGSTCELCGKGYIFSEIYPLQIPCGERHIICNVCFSENINEDNPQCPINGELLLELSPIKIFAPNFEAPKCPACKLYFNLEFHTPRVLPCKKVVCVMCINNKSQHPCDYCQELHGENYYPISKFFCDLALFTQVKCDLHRGIHASYYQKKLMKFACEECNKNCQDSEKIWDNGENISVLLKDFIIKIDEKERVLEKISVSAQDLEDGKYSNQAKVDIIKHIRSAKEKQFAENLKGREILQDEKLENSRAVLCRFLTVMPPQKWDGQCAFPYNPWFIDTENHQIEAVTFKADHRIKIAGLGVSIPLDCNENYVIDHIAIFEGENSMRNPDNIMVRGEHFVFKEFVQDIFFTEKVEIPMNTFWTIQMKINANFVYRGNPLDKPEFAVGSDCTKFEFKETTAGPDTYISSQNDIHGPIIKIYYDKVKED
ncbi:unnamed protein product [Blepharisma stoltei]|uniref:RING-type domain-containing protein n=1 Tax=Blepharisma stoltei TaxID=1481888 RepID=A0AAU9KK88_9CILI|nr:unnamed protein product [Blepharisma stoltei]